jgi:hypothetical protein
MDHTKLLEEDEREWRTSDSYWGPTAKHNAAMVANILRWGNFQKNPHTGFRQHVRYLEEKERRDRIQNTESAMQNAYNEAGLIKGMGAPFYVQEPVTGYRMSPSLFFSLCSIILTHTRRLLRSQQIRGA